MKTIPVSSRLTVHELAKARDGLIKKGIDPLHLTTKSQIIRLAIYAAIMNCDNPNHDPSDESIMIIGE